MGPPVTNRAVIALLFVSGRLIINHNDGNDDITKDFVPSSPSSSSGL